jgi:hypothetical protein
MKKMTFVKDAEGTKMTVNVTREDIIDRYIETFVDEWHCLIDHEDGSTAPFSSVAFQQCLVGY